MPIGGEIVATKDGRRVEPEALVRALGEEIDRTELVETARAQRARVSAQAVQRIVTFTEMWSDTFRRTSGFTDTP